jgi:hypothetical protein
VLEQELPDPRARRGRRPRGDRVGVELGVHLAQKAPARPPRAGGARGGARRCGTLRVPLRG